MDIIKDLNSGTLDSDDTEDLETELDKITERVSLVDRAVTALRKMGIGPRNKISDVDTTFIYAEKAQTGAEFVMSEQKEKMTAQELLMGKQTKKAPPKEQIDISNLGANSYVISEQGNVFGDGVSRRRATTHAVGTARTGKAQELPECRPEEGDAGRADGGRPSEEAAARGS